MLRSTTFLVLMTSAGALEAQLTPEQRAAREPAAGAPIWVSEVTDRTTHITTREYAVRARMADQARRARPDRRPLDESFGPEVATRDHWMALTSRGEAAAPVRRPAERVFPLFADQPTVITLAPRRAAPGTIAMIALRIDDADGVRHWSATATSVVDASRHHTLTLPGLPRGTYTLTIEVFNPEDPGIPESRSVNQLHVD